MNTEREIVEKTESFLHDNGLTLPELLNVLGKHKSSLLNLNDASYSRFAAIYEKIVEGDCDEQNKGKLLEELAEILFKDGGVSLFVCRKNCRTSTNELDLLVSWSEDARLNNISQMFPSFGDSFICECKNYKGKVNVTYVGKFCSLLLITGTKLGIMVAWNGVTGGSSWRDAQGLIKKIALKEGIFIIVLEQSDLKEIYEKKNNIFSMVEEKYLSLKDEIDYGKYIVKHGAESQLVE